MTGKIKVLEVNVDDQGNGGVYSLIKSVIENKPEDMQIDIAALEPFEKKENIKYLRSRGTRIFFVGYKGNKIKKQIYIYKHMCTLLKKERYDVVHIHADVSNKLFVSGLAAKMCNVSTIILHSHATGVDGKNRALKEKIHFAFRGRLRMLGAEYAACSYKAAKWMFPWAKKNDIFLLKNGIDLDKYHYNEKVRKSIRKVLNINKDDLLIGHVGRFMYQKNHTYILDIFEDISKRYKVINKKGQVRLLLVGDGELLPEIKKRAEKRGLIEKIIFYGLSNSVNELLQAMDVFIMPSNFEGFGIAALEAQASGLPVICSDKVPKSIRQTKSVNFLPITEKAIPKWSESILNIGTESRRDYCSLLEKKGFGIRSTVNSFINLYCADKMSFLESREENCQKKK